MGHPNPLAVVAGVTYGIPARYAARVDSDAGATVRVADLVPQANYIDPSLLSG